MRASQEAICPTKPPSPVMRKVSHSPEPASADVLVGHTAFLQSTFTKEDSYGTAT